MASSYLLCNSTLVFNVIRQKPELVRPTKPTKQPAKKLLLSDIDDQDSLRFQVPYIQVYKYNPYSSMKEKDPVKVIREALAKTLVFYYPFAGRLKEGPGRKLYVDCTDEGVLFVEADADITLEEFEHEFRPPFPCYEELLYDVPGYGGILHCPLLHLQVTRLKCGGFIVALRFNHAMVDGIGMTQFMSTIGEIAKGATSPSIAPIWQRELLSARKPPRVTCKHPEYDLNVPSININVPLFNDMIQRSFFFGPREIFIIKKILVPHLSKYSTFEILTAFLWRHRTIALRPNPRDEVRIICAQNVRSKFNPPLPIGYYGNALAFPVVLTTAEKLCNNPLDYALQLRAKTKSYVTEEYMKSVADLMVIKGRPSLNAIGTFIVSDNRRLGFDQVDFGWGKPVYGGIAKGDIGVIPGLISFYVPYVNKNGEKGTVVPICLPASAMDRFANELYHIFKYNDSPSMSLTRSIPTKSAL